MLKTSIALALCLPSTAVLAQGMLPPNSEVPLVLDREVSSKRMKVGDGFDLSVARDVWSGDRIVVPRGARARGVVVWKTGKGAFGKSGKLEIELRTLDVSGQIVPLTGKFRQEGQGNTAATVGTIVAAGVIAGMFVTGHSAVFAQGTELRGLTSAPLAATGAPPAPAPQLAQLPATVTPTPQPVAPAVVFVARPAVLQAAPAVAVASAAVPVAAIAAPVAFAAPVARSGLTPAASIVSSEDRAARYERLLGAQQGVRGREPRQGWTISD